MLRYWSNGSCRRNDVAEAPIQSRPELRVFCRMSTETDRAQKPREMSSDAEEPYRIGRGIACASTALLIGLAQGLGLNLVSSNLTFIQGSLGATAAEVSWLTSAYFATLLSGILLLTKVRVHFGFRRFANFALSGFFLVAIVHVFTDNLTSAIAARAALGIAAAPLSAMAVYYMMEAFPAPRAAVGLVLGFGALQLGAPLSRVISEDLLQIGQWHGLFLVDIALAGFCCAAINLVHLKPVPPQTAFALGDLITFPLYAAALALLCIVLTQGRLSWWTDAPWLGVCLACGIASFGLYAAIDLNRRSPLLDLHWLTRPFMLRFIVGVVLFRIVLSEQTVGVVGLMNVLGMTNDQMHGLFLLVTAGTALGFFIAVAFAALGQANLLVILAALLVASVAWVDSDATAVTRPSELLLTQTLLALATAMFFAGSCIIGFGKVLREGRKNIISFVAAFAVAQYGGTLVASAWITTVVAVRQGLHFAALTQHLRQGDPQLVARLSQTTGGYARFVIDPSARALQGIATLAQQVTRESFVLAYDDLFQMIALIACAIALWLTIVSVVASRERLRERLIQTPHANGSARS